MNQHQPQEGRLTETLFKHDINNLLGQILGFTELMLDELYDRGSSEYLHRLRQAHQIERELQSAIHARLSASQISTACVVSEEIVVAISAIARPAILKLNQLRLTELDFTAKVDEVEDIGRIQFASDNLLVLVEFTLTQVRMIKQHEDFVSHG